MLALTSTSSFETAALNLSYSSHSLAVLKSNERLLSPRDRSSQKFVHKRVVSNPFDVLYSDTAVNHLKTPELNDAKKYPGREYYMPKNIYTPEHLASKARAIAALPPVITMIDQSALHRSSSIISKEASLRNRFNIAKRNKMLNKKSLDIHSPSEETSSIYNHEYKNVPNKSNLRQKVKFMFPVQRKTSLKKQSAYKLLRDFRNKRCKFEKREDLEKFLAQVNAQALMKEILPSQMKIFKYSNLGLITRRPLPASVMRTFTINEHNDFKVISQHAKKLSVSAPFKETLTKNGLHAGGMNLTNAVYNRYREKAFTGKFETPPTFLQFFPEETNNDLISARDIEIMDRQLLFEILLRRTLAAKIDYRLKQNRQEAEEKTTSSSSSSSSSDSDTRNFRHSHIPKLIHTDSEESPDDDSIDTDDLMDQNVSLFSGLLPSPQISYKSNIFGSDFKLNQDYFRSSSDDMSSKNFKSEIKSRRTASTTDLLNLVKHVTPSHTPVESEFQRSPTLQVEKKMRQESLAAHQRDDELSILEKAMVGHSFSYELKPLGRSAETLSSSEDSDNLSKTPPLELSKNSSLKSFASGNSALMRQRLSSSTSTNKRESNTTTDSRYSSFDKNSNRKSQSTSGSSLMNDLDDLSSQLSSYMHDSGENKQPRFVHKNIISADDPLFVSNQDTNYKNDNIINSIKLTKRENETITIAPSPKNPRRDKLILNYQILDVKSMQGSISVVGSETSTNYSRGYSQYSLFRNYRENK